MTAYRTPTPSSPPSPLRAWLATLSARYDGAVLRDATHASPDAPTGHPTQHARTTAALRAWCERGSGDGRAPLWRPWVLPAMPEPLSVARWAPGAAAPAPGLVEGLMRALDRNDELATRAARSRGAALQLRLVVKARELAWWRPRHPQQAWDTGYLRGTPESLARLADFRPRRPTLVVLQGLAAADQARALSALQGAQAHFRHPVRLLLLDPPATLTGEATDIGAE